MRLFPEVAIPGLTGHGFRGGAAIRVRDLTEARQGVAPPPAPVVASDRIVAALQGKSEHPCSEQTDSAVHTVDQALLETLSRSPLHEFSNLGALTVQPIYEEFATTMETYLAYRAGLQNTQYHTRSALPAIVERPVVPKTQASLTPNEEDLLMWGSIHSRLKEIKTLLPKTQPRAKEQLHLQQWILGTCDGGQR